MSRFREMAALLGFLRLTLLGFALFNASLSLIDLALPAPTSETTTLWTIVAGVVAPVLAPIFVVVIFFDYLMSRVRAADETGETRARFTAISRIELAVIWITILCWLPFFWRLLN